MLNFTKQQLKVTQPRDDYRELLELIIIILRGVSSGKVKFKLPGANHHAKWMAKGIYALKLFMFRDQLILTDDERDSLLRFCCFVVNIYVKYWFMAPLSVCAPANDLKLLKDLDLYKSYDSQVYAAVFNKMTNHLWYLSEFLVCLALFDDDTSIETKRQILHKVFNTNVQANYLKRAQLSPVDIQNIQLHVFVTKNTLRFFEISKISSQFLYQDPSTWLDNNEYIYASKIVKAFKVTNDSAERGVALMTRYNKTLSKNEDDTQDLLKFVSETRKTWNNSSINKLC